MSARPPPSRLPARWALLAPALALLLAASAGPLLVVVVYSLLAPGDYGGVEWRFSLDAWKSVFASRDFLTETWAPSQAHLQIFWRSVKLSAVTTLATFLVGLPTAWFIATRPERQREIWLLLVMIPFWTNLLIRTFAIMQLLRGQGTINSLLLSAGLIQAPIQMLYTEFAVTLGMVYVYAPLMILPLYAAMARFDFTLLEAGFDLYANRLQVLRHIIVPLVRPGIVSGAILVFIPCLGAYVTPRILGGGTQLMLGNLIELQFGQARNWPLGAALSLSLLVIVGLALLAWARMAAREGQPPHHHHNPTEAS